MIICEKDDLVFSSDHSGARLSDLRRLAENRYLAISRPEFSPINPSTWYSFDVGSTNPRETEIQIMIDGTYPDTIPLMPARPWLSADGGNSWQQLDQSAWEKGEFTSTARVEIPVGTLRFSSYRPYTLEQAMAWCDEIEKLPFATGSSIGLSVEGRLIRQLTITETDALQFIVVLGGQHPPEVAGDHGLVYFVDTRKIQTALPADGSRLWKKKKVVSKLKPPSAPHQGHQGIGQTPHLGARHTLVNSPITRTSGKFAPNPGMKPEP